MGRGGRFGIASQLLNHTHTSDFRGQWSQILLLFGFPLHCGWRKAMMPVGSQSQFTSLWRIQARCLTCMTQRLIPLFLEPREPRYGCCLAATQRTGWGLGVTLSMNWEDVITVTQHMGPIFSVAIMRYFHCGKPGPWQAPQLASQPVGRVQVPNETN